MDRVKNAVLLVADLDRLRADQGSLVKDVIVPCSHRTDAVTTLILFWWSLFGFSKTKAQFSLFILSHIGSLENLPHFSPSI